MVIRHAPLRVKIIGLVVAFILLAGGAAAWFVLQSHQAIVLPQEVVSKTLFPIYVPSQLPAGFTLDDKTIGNDGDVLVFQIKDESNRVIAITEQSIPANFNFTDFYEKQVKGARTLGGTPFHSVIGESITKEGPGFKMLSIRADNTWVMVSGQNIGDSELEFIAKNLRKL